MSLPPGVVRDLDFVARRLRFTRSGLLSAVLAEAIGPLVTIANSLPPAGDDVTSDDVRRFRGVSAQVISETVAEYSKGEQDAKEKK